MVGGEALVRNLLRGYRECEALGGVMKVCYLPDAFGFISQLPQIAEGFGMHDVVLWRGAPRGSRTVFSWKGSDGTECLAFYMVGAYINAMHLPAELEDHTDTVDFTDIPRKGLKARVQRVLDRIGPRATTPHLLLMNGVDHQFPQTDLPAIIRTINGNIDDVEAIHSTLPQYIQTVRAHHERNDLGYEKAAGELRDPSEGCILTGSQSTRADVKMANSRIENLLERWVEPFSAFAWLLGRPYPKAEIDMAWEYLLQNHSHDN